MNKYKDALMISKMREEHFLQQIHNRNRLSIYTPLLFKYVVGVYVVSAILVYNQIGCEPLDQGTLSASLPHTPTLPDSFHSFTTGAFAAASALVFIQIVDTEAKSALRCSQLYCAALINTIAFLGHLAIAMRVVSPTMNAFNREVYITRLLEWISLVPVLMFMTFCQDIRSFSDSMWMCFFVITQIISVLSSSLANLTSDISLAVMLMAISSIASYSLYIALYRMILRRSIDAQADHTSLNDLKKSSYVVNIETDQILKEVLLNYKNVGTVISFYLLLCSTISQAILTITFVMGVLKMIDYNTEACIQASVDLLAHCVHTWVLCASHGTVLPPEALLMRLLVFEERSHAAFRQILRFVFHESANPLNCISVGMDVLSYQQLSTDGKNILDLARSKCDAISNSLNDVRYLQSIEFVKFRPFDIRKAVKDCTLAYADAAAENGVKLELEIDERIPHVLLGDKMRLKPVMSCLILNGIDKCPRPGGICIVSLTAPPVIDENAKTFHLTFSVKDNGDGLSQSEYDSLFVPKQGSSATDFSLAPFRKIIEDLPGSIDVKTTPQGSSFIVEVMLPLPVAYPNLSKTVSRDSPQHNSFEWFTKSIGRRSMMARTNVGQLSSPSSKTVSNSDLTVLVVDDVESNRLMASKILQLMGFTVEEAEDGDTAIDMCDDHREYTVMLIDNRMPRLPGASAVKTLRAKGYKGAIIGWTGIVDEDELEEFEASGCEAVIIKPLHIDELKRTLLSLKVCLVKK